MKFGVSIFVTAESGQPAQLAKAAEEKGFDSFWVSEHSHIPLSTQFPLGDGTVPMPYRSMYDPFVALAAAATATTKIKLGTAILIVPQHDAINCAKAISTIDQISGGRMIFGIGAGWNPPEMEHHGVAFENRFKMTRERLEAMKALWTQEEAEYHGDLVNFEKSWQYPKPVQKPYPPILVAGAGPNILKRVVSMGDGFLPVMAPVWDDSMEGKQTNLAELPNIVAETKRLEEEMGKPRTTITTLGLPATAEFVEMLEENEVERMILTLPGTSPEQDLETLDTYAEMIAPFIK